MDLGRVFVTGKNLVA